MPMLHSIYDLTTLCRKTSGDVPPKLVGASTTVIGSKMYLFGGRLVTERRMTSDLYMFDLESFEWEYIQPFVEDDAPRPRYFHSTDSWSNYLVLFGGMSNRPDSPNPEDLCVLSDVRFFDLETRHWLPEESLGVSPEDPNVPRARYAHLSSVTSDRLFIIGGQDFFNTWLDDVCVYDLAKRSWVQRRDYPRHCGTYRSVAVASNSTVRIPHDEQLASRALETFGPPGTRLQMDKTAPLTEVTPSDTLTHLSYTADPTDEHPSEIFLYSNYNFTDVKRELEVFSPSPDSGFTIDDRSDHMTGSMLPPGLRFPTGAVLGTYLIIAGTYLAHSYQSFSIWVLDLVSMTWSRIDPGKAIETGSWFRGCLWAEGNKFLIFGNRDGNLVDDYNHRLLSWDHVAVIDLEAFGIYQPPRLKLDARMQELGLAALEEKSLTDFEIVCDDGRKIPCSRKVLDERWPWFKLQRTQMLQRAQAALNRLPVSAMHPELPTVPGTASVEENQLDPRLTSRQLILSESWPVTMALLQYFYSMALVTPLQHSPAVLSQLLILGTTYQLAHLVSLVKHAMHRALTNTTSVGVYEVATLCSCRSLQIRALKTVMSYTHKKPPKSRQDKDKDNDRNSGDSGGPNGANGKNDSSHEDGGNGLSSRPRGTSDARWRTFGGNGAPSGTSYMSRGGKVPPSTPSKNSASQINREKQSPTSTTHRSPGSAAPLTHGHKRQSILVPPSQTREKHMPAENLRMHRRSHSSQASDEWRATSRAPGMFLQKSVPNTPSKRQTNSHNTGISKPVSPTPLLTPALRSNTPTTPTRQRPSPIVTDVTGHNIMILDEHARHTPNSSSSSSRSSFSSSSHNLRTPVTPYNKGPNPRVSDSSTKHNENGADDFTIVLNGEEAIHYTKQTSDLRLSPTRAKWTTVHRRPNSSLDSSHQTMPHVQRTLPFAPFSPTTSSFLASRVQLEGRRTQPSKYRGPNPEVTINARHNQPQPI